MRVTIPRVTLTFWKGTCENDAFVDHVGETPTVFLFTDPFLAKQFADVVNRGSTDEGHWSIGPYDDQGLREALRRFDEAAFLIAVDGSPDRRIAPKTVTPRAILDALDRGEDTIETSQS